MNKLREKIVEDFINALSEDVIPWERDWYMTVTPVNSNGNVYHGLNRYMLSFVQVEMKYKDNRWMTFKQANDKGYHVKKGEKGTRIEFWSLYDKERKCKITGEQAALLSSEEAKERLVPLVQEYTVFNAEQIEGIPPQKITDREQISVKELAKARDRITADFISCVAFDKAAEFAEKYLHQGTKIAITGRIQTGSYTNKEGQKVYTTDVVIEEQEFAESKNSSSSGRPELGTDADGFMNIPDNVDDEGLPF